MEPVSDELEVLNVELEAIVARGTEAVNEAADVASVRSAESAFDAEAGALRSRIGSLPTTDDKKQFGAALNDARQSFSATAEAKGEALAERERSERLAAERLDLTEVPSDPVVGHAHIVTQAWEELEDVFLGMGFRVAEGPEVETDWHNFDALNIPKGHPARDGFDTIYVNYGTRDESGRSNTVLRTHTSPVQIRTMLAQEPPIHVIAPGRVFRRDTADATHMPVFHQIEGLVVDRDISLADLAGTIEAFTTAYFGEGFSSRLRPNYFPFTEPSAEFDIRRPDGTWLELGGCGMVHPNVLRAGGIDPEEWSGFAFGFGVDRLALMKFGVDDLRELFTNDVRFLHQF